MRYLLTMVLLAGLLAGCSAMPSLGNATQATAPAGNRDSVSTTSVPTLEATMQGSNSGSSPLKITVGPPNVPIAPIQGTPGLPLPTASSLAGWQTFISGTMGAAIDFPADWSVVENNAGVKFTSSQGQIIQLQVDQTSASASTSGQDCSTLINSYGQAGDICFDAATSSYRAIFKNSTDASKTALALSTISQEQPTVFLQMFDSFRFTP